LSMSEIGVGVENKTVQGEKKGYERIVGEFEEKRFNSSKEKALREIGKVFWENKYVKKLKEFKDGDEYFAELGSGRENYISYKVLGIMFKSLGLKDKLGQEVEMEQIEEILLRGIRGEESFNFENGEGEMEMKFGGGSNFSIRIKEGLTAEKRDDILKEIENCETRKKLDRLEKKLIETGVDFSEKEIEVDEVYDYEEVLILEGGLSLMMYGEEEDLKRKDDENDWLKMKKVENGWVPILKVEAMKGREDKSFINSQTVKELFALWDSSNLEVRRTFLGSITEGVLGFDRDNFQSSMIEGDNGVHRSGNGFARVTRGLSHYIGASSESNLKSLFRNPNEESIERFKEGILKLEDKGAMLVGGMMLDLISDKEGLVGGREEKELWRDCTINMEDLGSCEDSENYLVSECLGSNKTDSDEDFVYYYNRPEARAVGVKDGYYMAMMRREMVVDGVRLPAGFLCRVSEVGGVRPIRASIFCFEEKDSREIFGKQFNKFESVVGKDWVSSRINAIRSLFEQ